MLWPIAELAFFALEVIRLLALSMIVAALALLVILLATALATRGR